MAKPRGVQKIAAVLLGIDKDAASALLKGLPDGPLETLTEAMVELSSSSHFGPNDAESSLDEFWQRLETGAAGVNDFQDLLSNALGEARAEEQFQRLAISKTEGDPFAPFERIPPREIADVLQDEHEQVCALVLAHLRPRTAARVLELLPSERRPLLMRRVAQTSPPSAGLLESLARSLLERFGPHPHSTASPGADSIGAAAAIMNYVSMDAERMIAEALQSEDEELYQNIDERRVTMEDLLGIDKKSMQKVLAGIDTRVLTMALKGASKEVEESILENVSKRSRETILEERDLLGAVPLIEVEAARKEFLNQVRALIKSGDVTLRRGGDDDFVE